MGTTRIKVIDLSTGEDQVKTSRKRAERGFKSEEIKKFGQKKEKGKKPKIVEEELKEAKEEVAEGEAKAEAVVKSEEKVARPAEPTAPAVGGRARGKAKKHSKKYLAAQIKLDKNKTFPIPDAVEKVKQSSISKFDGSVEVHFILTSQTKGRLAFPHSFGAKKKILIFANDLKPSDQIIIGNDQTIEDIKAGKLSAGKDFQAVFATAEFMPRLAAIAKILGPKGLMPSPKSGTVIDDPKKALKSVEEGQIEYKTEPKAPILHLIVGKISQKDSEIVDNLQKLITSLTPQKIKKAYLAPTIGPSVKLEI